MRVIAGRFKGRRLMAPVRGLRPSADRVRERLFAVLAAEAAPELAVDLFCGVGTLGIEALSRGVTRLVFVDCAPAHLRVLERNLAPLRSEALEVELEIVRADACRFVQERWPQRPVGWVFLDPPYGDPAGDRCLELLALEHAATLDWVIFEGPRALPAPPGLKRERTLEFGNTCVSLYRGGSAP